jgi:hypothetical protein
MCRSPTGNFSVHIVGGPFNITDELRCRFGSITVQAFYLNEGELSCYAPPHPAGTYPLEISINDQDYTSLRYPFFYYKDPELRRISPVAGPSDSAGTNVNVYGEGFVNSTFLTCRFGYTRTKGIFVSSNYIICPSPQLDSSNGTSGGLKWLALSEQRNRYPDSNVVKFLPPDATELEKRRLFPSAHYFPLYYSRLGIVFYFFHLHTVHTLIIAFIYLSFTVIYDDSDCGDQQ